MGAGMPAIVTVTPANSVVETEVRVSPGVLTAVELNHKAGVLTLAVSGEAEGSDELGLLAVLEGDEAAHGVEPDDVLVWRAVEDGVGVGELNCTVTLAMVENRHRFFPAIAIIPR